MDSTHFLMVFCALSFLGYGWHCLRSEFMGAEFRRYGLSRFRVLTGWLQLLGAAGLFIGLAAPWVGALAAVGLSLQMACGLGVRVRIGDRWQQCVPAAGYMLLCGWLALRLL